jgi:hypothetical protein
VILSVSVLNNFTVELSWPETVSDLSHVRVERANGSGGWAIYADLEAVVGTSVQVNVDNLTSNLYRASHQPVTLDIPDPAEWVYIGEGGFYEAVRPEFNIGGNVTGSAYHPSGRLVIRSDVGGIGIRDLDQGETRFRQGPLVHDPTLPWVPNLYMTTGVAMAPSNRDVIYVSGGGSLTSVASGTPGIAVTQNGGGSWAWTAVPTPMHGNEGNQKRLRNRLAVDPRAPGHALYGSQKNIWRTTDFGATWTEVVTPVNVDDTDRWGVSAVLFDDAAGAPTDGSGRTLRFWIACQAVGNVNNGFYRTNDGGVTWERIRFWRGDGVEESAGIARSLRRRPDGSLLVVGFWDLWLVANPGSTVTQTAGPSNEQTHLVMTVRSGSQGAYKPATMSSDIGGLMDANWKPSDQNAVYVVTQRIRKPAGHQWFYPDISSALTGTAPTAQNRRVNYYDGAGTEWVHTSNLSPDLSNFFNVVNTVEWTSYGLFMCDGISVWSPNVTPDLVTGEFIDYYNAGRGYEMMVCHDSAIVPAFTKEGVEYKARAIGAVWDKGLIAQDLGDTRWVGGSTMAPYMETGLNPSGHSIAIHPGDPSQVAVVVGAVAGGVTQPIIADRYDGYSEDGGRTFTRFSSLNTSTHPADLVHGNICFGATPDRLVWLPAASGSLRWSSNRGTSWNLAQGLPAGTWQAMIHYYYRRRVLVQDGVDWATIYLINQAGEATGEDGLWRSTDNGQNWSRIASTGLPAFGKQFNADLAPAPGVAGVMAFSMGWALNEEYDLRVSTNGGVTWVSRSAFPDATKIAWGAPKTSGGNPVLWVEHRDPAQAATIEGRRHRMISRSADYGVSADLTYRYPSGIFDRVISLGADRFTDPGVFMLGFSGTTATVVRRGGQSPAFDPASISGYVDDWDFTDTATRTVSSGKVVAVANKATASRPMSADESVAPSVATLNGVACALFEGAASTRLTYVGATDDIGQQAWTVFVVARPTNSTNGRLLTSSRVNLSGGDTVSSHTVFLTRLSTFTSSQVGTTALESVNRVSWPTNMLGVAVARSTGSHLGVRLNGTPGAGTTAVTPGSNSVGVLRIGANFSNGTLVPSSFYTGEVFRVVRYNRALSDSEVEQVEAWLSSGAGL